MTRQRLTYTTEIAQRILDELRRGRARCAAMQALRRTARCGNG
jgi:hypothetical protein